MSERLYRRIASQMRQAIADGTWPVGTRLPTEPELAAEHGVSRTTIRQALGELESHGLLDRRKRRGTTVAARRPDGLFRMDTGDLEPLLGVARDTVFEVMSMRPVCVEEAPLLAELCGSRDGTADASANGVADDAGAGARDGGPDGSSSRWLEIVGTRRLPDIEDGHPFSWSWIWVAPRYAAVGERLGPGTRSVYGAIEREFGTRVTRVAQRVSAVRCPAKIAHCLGLARAAPALEIVATLHDAEDEPIECTRALFDPARFQVHSNTRLRDD